MSFAAEPYGVFVDDLLAGLTGAVTRETFRYPPGKTAHQLGFRDDFVPETVRISGQVAGAFFRFVVDRDYQVDATGSINWLLYSDAPPAQSTAPEEGSLYYVSYERKPEVRAAPRLTDRNPGSVVRTLAESFAREYAVVSKQLETVYRGSFLDTAEKRDLDQLVALLGITRRDRLLARGEVVFSRSTPAAADIAIPAGTKISTRDVPAVTVITSEPRVLQAGLLSVAVPVLSTLSGLAGLADRDTLTLVHRPILGVDRVANPQALALPGSQESDVELRERARHALEGSGAATLAAIAAAVTSMDGIRPQDVDVYEDHVAHAGAVAVTVAAEIDRSAAKRVLDAIEAVRPAGIRILHNLVTEPLADAQPLPEAGEPAPVAPLIGVADDVWFPVGLRLRVQTADPGSGAAAREELAENVRRELVAHIRELGIGQPIIYNSLVARAMGVVGVLDVFIEVFPTYLAPGAPLIGSGRSNIAIARGKRARIEDTDTISVAAGAIVALDIRATVQAQARWRDVGPQQMEATIRDEFARQIGVALFGTKSINLTTLGPAQFGGDSFTVEEGDYEYRAHYLEQGVLLSGKNPALELDADHFGWLRSLDLTVLPPPDEAVDPGEGE